MTPNQFYKSKTKPELLALCESAKTSINNFKQIAIANGACGRRLAERLAASSEGEMTELEILYPERYELIKGKPA